MTSFDRKEIASFLTKQFPAMTPQHTSEDWHSLLNEVTGLDIPLDMPNSNAFDLWRKKLSEQGIPVWNYTSAQIAEIKAKGAQLKKLNDDWKKDHLALMERLAKEAPKIPAKNLLKKK